MSHYFDYAATAPMRASAQSALTLHSGAVGNPSSLHSAGRAARAVVEQAREDLAGAVGCRPSEIVWTSGGTEADNAAIKGMYWARRNANPELTRVVTTAVEHPAVLDSVRWLAEHHGATAVILPTDDVGRVDMGALREEIDRHGHQIALISVMWANNEVGAVQPIREVVSAAAALQIPVHSDAVQALGNIQVDFHDSGVAMLSLSSHKHGGPVGVGALVARTDISLEPLTHGGGQERKLRSGTVNAAGYAAAAAAAQEAMGGWEEEHQRLSSLQRSLISEVMSHVPDAYLSGPDPGPERLPGNVHFVFPGCAAEALMFVLDEHNIYASTGSACSAGVAQPSHVLQAMGRTAADAAATMRFSMGYQTTEQDLDALLSHLPAAVAKARRIGRSPVES